MGVNRISFDMEKQNSASLLLLIFWLMSPPIAKSQIRIDTLSIIKNDSSLYAIGISQNNKTVYQHYFNQKKATDLFNLQSLTKSVMSILTGIAIDKGLINSLDEKIIKFFPDLQKDTDQRKQTVTIRQIMNQSSGLYHEDLTRLGEFLALADPSSYTLKQPLLTFPDSIFHYNNAASHLLSVVISKASGMTTLDFAKKYLLEPMQIKKVEWMKMKDGYYDGSGLLSIRLSLMDMNKIGNLLLNSGSYQGHQLVSTDYVHQLFVPDKTFPTGWGFPGSLYGLCWYHKNYHGVPVIYGLGWGGQFNFIIPSLHAVVTVNESVDDATAVQQEIKFLSKIFPVIFEELGKK